MFYIYCLILILTAAGVAYYGVRYFGLSLAISFVVPAIILPLMLNLFGVTWTIVVLVIGVMTFLFTTPLTYFTAWFWGVLLVALIVLTFLDSIGVDINFKGESDVRKYIVQASMGVSLILVIIFRRHLKAIIIGLSSGSSFGLGLSGIISAELYKSGKVLDAVLLPSVLISVMAIGGVIFQYTYVKKKYPKLFDPTGRLTGGSEHSEKIIG